MTHRDPESPDEQKRQSRRRLLATLGVGMAGAYVAPTLFTLGQAQAHQGRSRPSHSRPSYSRPSYSRPSYSRPSGGYRGDRRDGYSRRDDDARQSIRLILSVTPSRW
ncbi:hypothetical protein [Halomonas tibetensis]|uniref:Uncharacterized protein n=1 Tax=Halomonas tibetensis TaxID=2259590 RepID=A0ABV7B8J4_9GAMM